MPNTIDDISGLPDHDILVRMYQKLVDHLAEHNEEKNAMRHILDDHEERICHLEESQTVEATKDGLFYAVLRHPITLVILGCAISFVSWAGYKLICHIFGVRI